MGTYTVQVNKFTAVDESGIDWLGSDEPMWVFTANAGGKVRTTHSKEFGDVDSGDSVAFETADRRNTVWPAPRHAAGAAGPIGLSIQLWEMDQGDPDDVARRTKQALDLAQWAPVVGDWVAKARGVIQGSLIKLIQDDLMGSRTLFWSAATLARRLPRAGDNFSQKFRFSGNSGDLPFDVAGGPDYDLYVTVNRVG